MAVNKIGLTGETPEDINDERIGDLSELTTETKASVVAAINEVNGGGGEIYHIEFDQENSTITHDGEELNWLEFAQKIEAGAPIVLTGTVTPPGDVEHNIQVATYFLADASQGVLIFPMMFWTMSGETATFAQIIVNCSDHLAFYTIGTVGYTHQYPPMD